jgi:hypothetical protein
MQRSKLKGFSVYVHRRADDGLCFYVGMGRPARPFDHKNRSTYWLRTAALHGVITEVLYTGLSFDEAVIIERSYIVHFTKSPLAKLVNLTSGGEGMKGVKDSDGTRQRKSESAIKLNNDPLFKEKKLAQLTAARESAACKDAIRTRFNDPKFLEQHLMRFEKNRGSISAARAAAYTPDACAKRGRSVSAYLKAPETRHVGLMKVALMSATRWKHPFTKLPKDYFK